MVFELMRICKNGFTRFREKSFADACTGYAYCDSCGGGCPAEMEKRGARLKSIWNEGK